jgi:hypothetical protein
MSNWKLILEILGKVIKWLDWYFSGERKKMKAINKMHNKALKTKNKTEYIAAWRRRKGIEK